MVNLGLYPLMRRSKFRFYGKNSVSLRSSIGRPETPRCRGYLIGFKMRHIHNYLKKAFTSVTIMVIPHDNLRELNLKVPAVGLLVSIALAMIGGGYVLCLAVNGLGYKAQNREMAEKLEFYSGEFDQWASTATDLIAVDREFRTLFSLGSKDEILENVDTSFTGSLDIPNLVSELEKTVETVDEIKNYLRIQKDMYVATPKGYPAAGDIASHFGRRIDPMSGDRSFHSGVDIAGIPGSPVRATADGVVSLSESTKMSGNVVVLEHGCGFKTIYAHNRKNAVKVGQRVKRGDILGYLGSTGKSTGPHVHYEVWKDGRAVNAEQYLKRRT